MDTIEILKRWALNLFYRKREFTTTSTGAGNAYQPAILNRNGYFDPSLINGDLAIDTLFANGPSIANGGGKGVYVSGPMFDGTYLVSGLVGFNVRYDGVNYKVGTDGSTNGGILLVGRDSGDAYDVYIFPSTGTTVQTITPANLSSYFQFQISSTGVLIFGNLTIGNSNPSTSASYDIKMPAGSSTVNSGNGRELAITAGSSDNSGGKRGGHLYLRPGPPTSPATTYGNVVLADLGGDVSIASGGGNVTAGGAIGGTFTNLSYNSGWSDFGGGGGSVRYRKFGDKVQVSGLAKRTSIGNASVGTLPVGFRPLSSQRMMYGVFSDGTEKVIRIDIATDGSIQPNVGAVTINYLSLEFEFPIAG